MSGKRDFRTVNQILGTQPRLGPFPADQVVPWSLIGLLGYILKQLLGWNLLWTGLFVAWGWATWWTLTGAKGWMFLSKFIGVPRIVRGYKRFQPLLSHPSSRYRRK
ncbi:hypothetical protein [Coleofasciculus sp. G3-WIS-01]|uniref:hypothetical protein n=1 Tax=unclassified Coleofasciculus TaxID=2692782 RepID=UPI0032F9F00D